MKYNLRLKPKSVSTTHYERSHWRSNLPLRLSFESGGNADPNSDKKITLSVAPGKTLTFEGVNGLNVYTFKKAKGKKLV